MKYCSRFYDYLYIDDNFGNVCLCQWLESPHASIGSLMTDDILSIYNSDHANQLRKTMDDQSFKYCRVEACPYLPNNELEEITLVEYESRKKEHYYPTTINMAYDFVCNQSCETCRSTVFTPPRDYAEQVNTIGEKLAPFLNTAKRITASGHGDPFASKYMMAVLENLHPINPDLTILLETNGVFFDKEHWERIKHLAMFSLEIVLTSNSFDEFTYNHISRGGNFSKLMKNLEFGSQLRKNNEIKVFRHSFVLQDRNFRELPEFIKRSFDDYAFDSVVIKPVYQWGTMNEHVYWFKDVLNPLHPYHQEYLEIIRDPLLSDPRVYNFGGNTVHEARPYPAHEISMSSLCSKVAEGSRVIIYGAGQIGREYLKQIEETQYCNIVLWVDRSNDDVCIFAPYRIADLDVTDYDYVVLATNNLKFREEMKKTLTELGVPDKQVI